MSTLTSALDTTGGIFALIGRYTSAIVEEQIALESEFIGSGALEKVSIPDKVGVVNVKSGTNTATGALLDGGSLPTGGAATMVQGTYIPKILFTRLSLGRLLVRLAKGGADGVNYLKEQMEGAGQHLGQLLAGNVFHGGAIDTGSYNSSTTGAAGAVTSIDVSTDIAGWKVGAAVDVVLDSSGATQETITITDVAPDGDGTYTVSFTGSDGGADNASAWGSGGGAAVTFYLKGSGGSSGGGFAASLQACAGSGTMYNITSSEADWSGNLDSNTSALTGTALQTLHVAVRRRSHQRATHVIGNSLNEKRLYDAMDDQVRYIKGVTDQYGNKLEVAGLPFICDENVRDGYVFLFNKRHYKLHEFMKFQPEIDGGAAAAMNMSAALVGTSNYDFDIQIGGAYEGRCLRRNALGAMSAITS